MSAGIAFEPLLTAEQFARRPDSGLSEELVKGRIVPMPTPNRRHGQICFQVAFLLGQFVKQRGLGHVLTNDGGVITQRGPDTVRGPDVAYYSYARLPKGPLPASYGPEMPELVVEVRSPDDRWPLVLAKVAEYLQAGTSVVIVLDDKRRVAHFFDAEGTTREIMAHEELAMPAVLGDFRVPVSRFFE